VRDQVFSGRDIEDALAQAASALGLARTELRYVVLDPGRPGGRGLNPTPARIAVLLGGGEERGVARRSAPEPAPSTEPLAALRQLVRRLADAAGIELDAEAKNEPDLLRVRIVGAGCELLLENDGAVWRAFEHLLQRSLGWRLGQRRLFLECEGYRERREALLTARAHQLADAVRGDGLPRRTEPLNAYERRIIHLALDGDTGVRTYSEGEGNDRRVTIAPSVAREPGE
jgi:spoIIIJ-associated protein